MASIIVDDGLTRMLNLLINNDVLDDLYLHLYVAAHTPVVTDDETFYFANEADPMTGYAPVLLNPTGWFVNVTGGVISFLYPPVEWLFTSGPFTVYGFFITQGTGGSLIFAGDTATPQAVDAMGSPPVTVSVQLQNKNCP
jgi:hypothetical protein